MNRYCKKSIIPTAIDKYEINKIKIQLIKWSTNQISLQGKIIKMDNRKTERGLYLANSSL